VSREETEGKGNRRAVSILRDGWHSAQSRKESGKAVWHADRTALHAQNTYPSISMQEIKATYKWLIGTFSP
jgi:hypothetical protein